VTTVEVNEIDQDVNITQQITEVEIVDPATDVNVTETVTSVVVQETVQEVTVVTQAVIPAGLATEAKQDSIIDAVEVLEKPRIRNVSTSSDPQAATYKYFGFEYDDGAWRIMRKTLASNTFEYATGASAYTTAWTNRASQSYA
jgi:hypothetical protein